MNEFSLEGRVAVVTGGATGIGLAIARALAGAGAKVVLSSRSAGPGEEAAGALRGEGLSAQFVPCDVSEPESVDRLVRTVLDEHGRLDAMVTSAGRILVKAALEITADELDGL